MLWLLNQKCMFLVFSTTEKKWRCVKMNFYVNYKPSSEPNHRIKNLVDRKYFNYRFKAEKTVTVYIIVTCFQWFLLSKKHTCCCVRKKNIFQSSQLMIFSVNHAEGLYFNVVCTLISWNEHPCIHELADCGLKKQVWIGPGGCVLYRPWLRWYLWVIVCVFLLSANEMHLFRIN